METIFKAEVTEAAKAAGAKVRLCLVEPHSDGSRFHHYTYSDHPTKEAAWARVKKAGMTAAHKGGPVQPRQKCFFALCL